MKSLLKILPILFMTIFVACEDCSDDPQSEQVAVQLNFINDKPMSLAGLKVVATNTQRGLVYTQLTDESGIAVINVEAGMYTFSVQYRVSANNVVNIYSGSTTEQIIVSTTKLSIDMVHSQSGQILIKEIYYSGCKGADGKNYTNDQYLILYNNSSDTAYLDSLCIAHAYPTRATSQSPFYANSVKYQFVPAFNFAWMFPGSGHDYPIAPGEEVVVAPNCINHVALGNENSIDLSCSGYWACYSNSAGLTRQSPPATPEKRMLKLIWKDQGTSCICSIFDPAFIIWKIQGNIDEYLANSIVSDPEKPTSKNVYLSVPFDWIYDGVECLASSYGNKRLASVIDNGGVINSKGSGSSSAVIRYVDEDATKQVGRIVYRDTNNSTDDFYVTTPSLKK